MGKYVSLVYTSTRILDILIYFRIRHSFAHLRPMILSADWSISRLQSWTCSSLPAVAEFVKLTQSVGAPQSIVIEMQWQSADLYKVQLCNRQFFVVSTTIYVVKVYECHRLLFARFWIRILKEYDMIYKRVWLDRDDLQQSLIYRVSVSPW